MKNQIKLFTVITIVMLIITCTSTYGEQSLMVNITHSSSSQPNDTPDKNTGLIQLLIAYAKSENPDLHLKFSKTISELNVLDTLNPQKDFLQPLEILATNISASAQDTFISLTTNEVFLADDDRALALVRASQHIHTPSQQLVKFWDSYSQPDDGFTPITIKVLLANGNAEAISLLEKKFTDTTHDDAEKIAWMRMDILRHRNDLLVLQACQRLLEGKLAESLRSDLVDVLFDYKPQHWYRPAVHASPPELNTASQAALDALHTLAIYSLNRINLSQEQRTAVKKRLEEIDKLRHE